MGAAALLVTSSLAQADDPRALRSEAERLRAANTGLAAQVQEALLELYALESSFGRADRRLAALESRAAELERREASARRALAIARSDLAAAERQLASRLQTLYVEGEVDPLAVLLGAQSLGEGLSALDGLDRLATQDRAILEQVRVSRQAHASSVRELSARRTEVRALAAEAAATRASLARARSQRASYLARLRDRQALNQRQIARLLDQAAAADSQTQAVAPASAPVSAPAQTSAPAPAEAPAPAGGRGMTVSATGYCLRGTTATGIPVGWGVVAVDPAVIPLGTRMYVPGYGEGVAADTGSAVTGATIDLWFPSCSQAISWGRRTVTITLR